MHEHGKRQCITGTLNTAQSRMMSSVSRDLLKFSVHSMLLNPKFHNHTEQCNRDGERCIKIPYYSVRYTHSETHPSGEQNDNARQKQHSMDDNHWNGKRGRRAIRFWYTHFLLSCDTLNAEHVRNVTSGICNGTTPLKILFSFTVALNTTCTS